MAKYNIGDVVWVEEPTNYSYLRETRYTTLGYRPPLKKKIWQGQKVIVGFKLVTRGKVGGRNLNTFLVWWLKTYDRDFMPNGIYKFHMPSEGVVVSELLDKIKDVKI